MSCPLSQRSAGRHGNQSTHDPASCRVRCGAPCTGWLQASPLLFDASTVIIKALPSSAGCWAWCMACGCGRSGGGGGSPLRTSGAATAGRQQALESSVTPPPLPLSPPPPAHMPSPITCAPCSSVHDHHWAAVPLLGSGNGITKHKWYICKWLRLARMQDWVVCVFVCGGGVGGGGEGR